MSERKANVPPMTLTNATVVILRDIGLEAAIRNSFPWAKVVRVSETARGRSLVAQGRANMLVVRIRRPRPQLIRTFRSIARFVDRHRVPTLFVADTVLDYGKAVEELGISPLIGVAWGVEEVRPMINLLWKRIAFAHV